MPLKTLLTFSFIFVVVVAFAQVQNVLTIQNDTSLIVLESIDIKVEVIGNIATTTTELTFFNPNDRILEGELNFPLTDGQQVFRFAMDVNGKLREGVVVEKNLGRRAFEGVVRRAIDPGLLEMTVGNNYKSRVYPIPANGRKRILIGYEEELSNGKSPLYQLALAYGNVANFKLEVDVLKQEFKPQIKKNELVNVKFKKWKSSFRTKLSEKDFNASGLFSFEIPTNTSDKVVSQSINGEHYFYLTVNPELVAIAKERPTSIGIFWDASASAKDRDFEKELKLITTYISSFEQLEVHVIKFSNEAHESALFNISNGNSTDIITYLKDTDYDGGTNLNALNLQQHQYDELFLFSDGISNLDEFQLNGLLPPTHTISSSITSNSPLLKYIADYSGGQFINLHKTKVEDAKDLLSNQNYQFISAEYNKQRVSEVYPNRPTSINQRSFSLAGKLSSKRVTSIRLNFGIGGKILKTKELTIANYTTSNTVARFWAKKKLEELVSQPKDNKIAIIELGKAYSLVTPHTSLIILDLVEDYVKYKIEPPAELKKEYDTLIGQINDEKTSQETDIIDDLLEDFEDRLTWWANKVDTVVYTKMVVPSPPLEGEILEEYVSVPTTPSLEKESSTQSTIVQNPEPVDTTSPNPTLVQNVSTETDTTQNQSESSTTSSLPTGGSYSSGHKNSILQTNPTVTDPIADPLIFNRTISGTVKDENGELLFGANIKIKGTPYLTMADLEGRYTLNVRNADVLVISYIGYSQKEVLVGEESVIDIQLESGVELSEVIVAAHAPLRSIRKVSSSIQVLDKQINSIPAYQEADALTTITYTTSTIDQSYSDEESFSDTDIDFDEWEANEGYLDSLKSVDLKEQYITYLRLKEDYGQTPSFYLIVGNYFIQNDQEKLGLKVLSNIAELQLENHEIIKLLAHKYRQIGQHEISIYLFQKILDMRPLEPHSKRDLALAYQASGDYQKALELFKDILMIDFENDEEDLADRFPLIKSTVLHEMNNLITLHQKELDLKDIPKLLIKPMAVDIRVVLNWNTLETDIDLWITEPNGEKCSYNNELTEIGGRLTEDMTEGFGPEEYLLRNAIPGKYSIAVDYYDDRSQKVAGPVTLQVAIYTNYGTEKQKVKEITLQLTDEKEHIEVGHFVWE